MCYPHERVWVERLLQEHSQGATFSEPKLMSHIIETPEVKLQVGERYFRGIAKIGLHYFLSQFPVYSGHEQIFSRIRSFIFEETTEPIRRVDEFIQVRCHPLVLPMLDPNARPVTGGGRTSSRRRHVSESARLIFKCSSRSIIQDASTRSTWQRTPQSPRIMPLSISTDIFRAVRNRFGTFRLVMRYAKSCGFLQSLPDFEDLRFPRRGLINQPCFTVAESMRIIEVAREPFKTMFWLVAETGMRGGEVCGLQIEDVLDRAVFVRRSAWRGKLQTPKSQKAVRRRDFFGAVRASGAAYRKPDNRASVSNPRRDTVR